jgi:hypothetical protein
MAITDTLTYGVQFRKPGDTDVTVKVVDALDINAELDDIRIRFGTIGKVVTKPVTEWAVETKLTGDFARQVAEDTIRDLSEGEIADERAMELLRPLGSGLLNEAEAVARTAAGLPFSEECTYAGWLEQAVNLHDECELVSDRLAKDPTGNVGADYDNHIAVLAGLADHAPNGCTRCSVVSTPAKAAEVAA